MLKKLLKYDLKSIFKFLIIFYILAVFFGILTRLFGSIENSIIMNIIGQICSCVSISMIFNILINNLMRLWVRFKENLYGDESYLTHTLPIQKSILYLSKVLTAIITLFISIVVIGLTIFIAYYSKENLEMFKNTFLPIANAYNSTIVKILLAFLFVFFIEFANILQSGFTGIILGYRMNNSKIGYSLLFGFIVYIVSQMFIVFMLFVVALFNKDLMNLFYTTEIINVDMIKFIVYLAIVIYTMIFIGGYLINLRLFKKGVNID